MAITAALAGSKPRTLAECWKTVFYKPVSRRKLRCSQTIPEKCLSLGTVHAVPKASCPESVCPCGTESVCPCAPGKRRKRLSLRAHTESVCPCARTRKASVPAHAHLRTLRQSGKASVPAHALCARMRTSPAQRHKRLTTCLLHNGFKSTTLALSCFCVLVRFGLVRCFFNASRRPTQTRLPINFFSQGLI